MSTFNKYRTKGAYHYEWYETEDWYRYLIDRAVKFCQGKTIDIGCGDGVLTNKIAGNGYEALGVDPNIDAIILARQNGEGSFLDIDPTKDLPTKKWDYLASINVIEHLDNPEAIKGIIKKNIVKGAIITTIDYQGGSLGEDHKFEWTYDEMMDFFKEFNPKGFRYKDTEWIGVEIKKPWRVAT